MLHQVHARAKARVVDGVSPATSLRMGIPFRFDPNQLTHHRCEGGCGTEVGRRFDWCEICKALSKQKIKGMALIEAYRSIDPDMVWWFCRGHRQDIPADPEYVKATESARKYAEAKKNNVALDLINKGRWHRALGNVLLLGPTGIGKSKVLFAVAHRILDYAYFNEIDSKMLRFAAGIRLVTGIELGRATAEHKRNDGEPAILRTAKTASLLLLDDVGYEDKQWDPHAVRNVMSHRYDRSLPTIATSGKTTKQLITIYGEATTRRFWDRGIPVDLHP